MLNMYVTLDGFDNFINKLGYLSGTGLVSNGFQKYTERVRDIVIDGTPVGDPETDEHSGQMKRSWEKPVYSNRGNSVSATITNSANYSYASNYGHFQTPGIYVPAIGKRLVHYWVPGTYALETSLDNASFEFESVIRPEILREWNEPTGSYTSWGAVKTTRHTYYDRPGEET